MRIEPVVLEDRWLRLEPYVPALKGETDEDWPRVRAGLDARLAAFAV